MANPLRLAAIALVALAAEATSAYGDTAGANYFTVVPCRVYDTRTPIHDPLQGGPDRRRDIQVSGFCGVPAEAMAVTVNLTGINASRAGSLAVYDADLEGALPVLELRAGRTRANNAIVGLSAEGKIAAELSADFASPADTANLAIDVVGYFIEDVPPTAADDQATVAQVSANNPIDVLANDTDPDGGTKLVIAVDTTGTLGSVSVTGGGSGVSYTPAPGYCNTPPGTTLDTFAYTITGGSTAQVAVTVLCPEIQIVKNTNGQNANFPPGPSIALGSPVIWTYQVTNIGDVPLSEIKVTDDKGVTVSCPKTSLGVGQTMNCAGNGLAQACQYSNVGTVTAKTPGGETVADNDPSHYFGIPCE